MTEPQDGDDPLAGRILVSAANAAEALGWTRAAFERFVDARGIGFIQIGDTRRMRRYRVSDVRALRDGTPEPVPEPSPDPPAPVRPPLPEGWAATTSTPTGWLYFVACPAHERVKIGRADSLPRRLREIQAMNPYPLVLLGVVYERRMLTGVWFDERMVHDLFAADRIHGEWFRLTDRLRAWIDEHGLPLGVPIDEALEAWNDHIRAVQAAAKRNADITRKRMATRRAREAEQAVTR